MTTSQKYSAQSHGEILPESPIARAIDTHRARNMKHAIEKRADRSQRRLWRRGLFLPSGAFPLAGGSRLWCAGDHPGDRKPRCWDAISEYLCMCRNENQNEYPNGKNVRFHIGSYAELHWIF